MKTFPAERIKVLVKQPNWPDISRWLDDHGQEIGSDARILAMSGTGTTFDFMDLDVALMFKLAHGGR